MIPGVKVTLGGTEYIVPPLLKSQLVDRFRGSRDKHGLDDTDLHLELIWMALKRNYPEMTRADVDLLVDAGNIRELVHAVLVNSPIRLPLREIR